MSISELIEAIDDTQAALNTGKLYSRNGNLLGEFSSYLEFRTQDFKKNFEKIILRLQKIKRLASNLSYLLERNMDMSKYHFGCSPYMQIICCCLDCIKEKKMVDNFIQLMDEIDEERNSIITLLQNLGLGNLRLIELSSKAAESNSRRWERKV